MPVDSGLGGDDYAASDFRASGNAGLSDENRGFTENDVVSNLHEVVDFRSFLDPGFAEAGAVDAGIRADFNIVVDLHDSVLGNLDETAEGWCVTEAVGADDGTRMDDDAVAEDAAVHDGDIGVDDAVFADFGVVTDICAAADDRVVADFSMSLDNGVGADIDVFSEFGGRVDVCAGADARFVADRFGRVLAAEPRERFVGRFAEDERTVFGRFKFHAVFDEDDSRFSFIELFAVLDGGEEGGVVRRGEAEGVHAGNHSLFVARDGSADEFRDLFCTECFHEKLLLFSGGSAGVEFFE